jgi:hypothetical protein
MSDDGDRFVFRGMRFYEEEVVARVTEIALRETREIWLRVLEETLPRLGDDDLIQKTIFTAEILRLRRLLGLIPSDEARRSGIRERVRQHRERKKQGIVLRPRREPAPPVTREAIAEDLKRQLDAWRETERIKREAKAEA